MPFTREQVKEYIKNGGRRCPYCGSDEIEGDDLDFEAEGIYQEVYCLDCENEWYDIHKLIGIKERG
jgi:hypothetical protein